MATIKRQKKSTGKSVQAERPKPPSKLRSISLPRMRVVLCLVVVALFGWAMQVVWQRVAPAVIHREPYLLSAERITMTPQPEWITTDIRGEVIRNAGLDQRLSILDDGFMGVVQDGFVLHPWINSVEKITKQFPAGVHVEVTFRKPVAVVEMASEAGMLLVPLDERGIVLPLDDVPEIRKRYMPRIQNIVDRPPVGQKWENERVQGAVDLAVRLADVWESLHLVDILPSTRPEILDEHRFYVYDLMTRGGTRVVWGAAPGIAPPGEADFAAKLDRLRNCVTQHGPLDTVQSPAIVDVRNQLMVTPRTVKKTTGPRTVKKEDPVDADTPVVK
ncbi:MAG: hypothetical protein SH868_03965 [Bythopirellula sp.]|nr:hypothetical protein [Bythopirellula sp.]